MKSAVGFCRIYSADVTPLASSALFNRVYASVPACRREKADRLRHPEGKRLSLGAGALLTCALRSAGIDPLTAVFGEGPRGKPFLPGEPEIRFSLSHAGTQVLCVLSSLSCGCDVEQIGRGTPALARRFFAAEETAALDQALAAGGEEAFQSLFTRIWTRKESFLKATGDGFFRPLNSFSVLREDPALQYLEHAARPDCLSCVCLLAEPGEGPRETPSAWPAPEWIPVSLEEISL